jgi:hypothetical protein
LLKAAVETPSDSSDGDASSSDTLARGRGNSAFSSRKRKLLQRGDNETWHECVKRLKHQELKQTLVERGLTTLGARETLEVKLAKALEVEESQGVL